MGYTIKDYVSNKGKIEVVSETRINDLLYINRYLEKLNLSMKIGENFAGYFENFSARKKRLFVNNIPIVRIVYFGFEFLIKRVLPKIKYLNRFYLILTKGKNRLLSKAEVLGRLVCCGFDILEVESIDGLIFFTARKAREPLFVEMKNYGLLFKMKRVGKNGKLFYIYKIRTMHPFSEFLQDYVTETSGYSNVGKINNDFRLTPWGRILRKFWLDELPQIFNLIKGQINLIGPRPVSISYFDRIPEDLRLERIKVKPGLIPPYVSLRYSSSVENVLKAERIYLKEKLEKPYSTNLRYFFYAVYNIIFKKIRSN